MAEAVDFRLFITVTEREWIRIIVSNNSETNEDGGITDKYRHPQINKAGASESGLARGSLHLGDLAGDVLIQMYFREVFTLLSPRVSSIYLLSMVESVLT